MATVISENTNAPYYGYRGCKKVIPRTWQTFGATTSDHSAQQAVSEQLSIFSKFKLSAFGQTFNIRASNYGRFWIYCNSCQGYLNRNSSNETYYLPYQLFIYSNLNDPFFLANQSDLYSEISLEYYKETSDYLKYIIKGSVPYSTNKGAFYIEYLFKSDGVIQIKSTRTISGMCITFSKDADNENFKLLNDFTIEAGVSYVIKLSGSLTSPEATLYTQACVDYAETYPVLGMLNISTPSVLPYEGSSYELTPYFRNIIYPNGSLSSSEKKLCIKTQKGVGELLLSTSPNSNIPHLGIGQGGFSYKVTDDESSIKEYLVRTSDWYSYDNIDLTYTNFYVNSYSTNRYWNEVTVEYLSIPVTGVTQIDILFRNIGGKSDNLPNSSNKTLYLCYASKHGYGSSSSSSSYWKNIRYTLKKAYLGGCVEMITFNFSSPVTIAEFCLLPPPLAGYTKWCVIESWCIHTNNNVITNYAQTGAVRDIN